MPAAASCGNMSVRVARHCAAVLATLGSVCDASSSKMGMAGKIASVVPAPVCRCQIYTYTVHDACWELYVHMV